MKISKIVLTLALCAVGFTASAATCLAKSQKDQTCEGYANGPDNNDNVLGQRALENCNDYCKSPDGVLYRDCIIFSCAN